MTSASSSKKNGLVIADSGAIFSLAVLDQLELLHVLFDDAAIPNAVWEEITLDRTVSFYGRMRSFFKERVRSVTGMNALTPLMDYGEYKHLLDAAEPAMTAGKPFAAQLSVLRSRKRATGTSKMTASFLAVARLIARLPRSILETSCLGTPPSRSPSWACVIC